MRAITETKPARGFFWMAWALLAVHRAAAQDLPCMNDLDCPRGMECDQFHLRGLPDSRHHVRLHVRPRESQGVAAWVRNSNAIR